MGLISFFTGNFPTDINRSSAWFLGTNSGIINESVFKNKPQKKPQTNPKPGLLVIIQESEHFFLIFLFNIIENETALKSVMSPSAYCTQSEHYFIAGSQETRLTINS